MLHVSDVIFFSYCVIGDKRIL